MTGNVGEVAWFLILRFPMVAGFISGVCSAVLYLILDLGLDILKDRGVQKAEWQSSCKVGLGSLVRRTQVNIGR